MPSGGNPTLRPATHADAQSIAGLLQRSGLPASDLGTARPEFLIASSDGQVIGIGALQHFGATALLRSIAIEPPWRGRGVGRLVVEELERRARAADIRELVLLTLTARDFFERLGYIVRGREQVAPAVLDSTEFRTLCPATAVCMAKILR